MVSLVGFGIAAFCEIAGCFAVWSYFRLGRPAWVLAPAVLLLLLFAYALTRADATFAGRAYAAYGGIYVVASIAWLRLAEGVRPDRWDILGGLVCLSGTLIIVFGKR